MTQKASSRERLLAAIDGEPGAPVPCCFMIFRALRQQCRDEYEFAQRQLDMGLDVRMELDDFPVRFSPEVAIREWVEAGLDDGPALLHRIYSTPAGELTAAVRQAEDWPYGARLPIFDDYVTPRAVKVPVTGPGDLEALRYLLVPPTDADIAAFRTEARARREFAQQHGLLLAAGWKSHRTVPGEDPGLIGANGGTGTVVDALMWLCGGTAPLLWAYDEPEFLAVLIGAVEEWNSARLEIHLEAGVDLVLRRAWYEGTDFWSPSLYRQFILPGLCREVALAHQYGARYGYIITTGMIHIAEALIESGIDVIVGVDPGEGKDTTLAAVQESLAGRVALWGGVSGPLSVEQGSADEVRRAVEEAIATLGPSGRFIVCPVDNVRADTARSWRNVKAFLETWQALAG
jgi:uroporphyrinogen-III decarboxylase